MVEWNGGVDYWSGVLDWIILLEYHTHKYTYM